MQSSHLLTISCNSTPVRPSLSQAGQSGGVQPQERAYKDGAKCLGYVWTALFHQCP